MHVCFNPNPSSGPNSRGIRHRLRAAFLGKPGWVLVGNRGRRYSSDLASSQFYPYHGLTYHGLT